MSMLGGPMLISMLSLICRPGAADSKSEMGAVLRPCDRDAFAAVIETPGSTRSMYPCRERIGTQGRKPCFWC